MSSEDGQISYAINVDRQVHLDMSGWAFESTELSNVLKGRDYIGWARPYKFHVTVDCIDTEAAKAKITEVACQLHKQREIEHRLNKVEGSSYFYLIGDNQLVVNLNKLNWLSPVEQGKVKANLAAHSALHVVGYDGFLVITPKKPRIDSDKLIEALRNVLAHKARTLPVEQPEAVFLDSVDD